ncbi:MAG: hypothetical protein IJS08_12670 [Victivallales bacterium]|nr:hypothetical protein [Victivallales bacterium]
MADEILEIYQGPDNTDDWDDLTKKGPNGKVHIIDEPINNETDIVAQGWVGAGDQVDYMAFTMETAGWLSLDVTSYTDAVYVAIYRLYATTLNGSTTYKLVAVKDTTTSKAGDRYVGTTPRNVLGAGTYYIGVKPQTASSKASINYTISVNKSPNHSVFFPAGDNGDDWDDFATKGPEGKVDHDTIGTLTPNTEINGWVGYGDKVDYMEFTLATEATVSLDIESSDYAKAVIYRLQKNAASYTLISLQSTTLAKIDNTSNASEATTKALKLAAGTYYLGIFSPNADNGANASYTITVNDNSNIPYTDTTGPTITCTADTTPTNGNVTVTATFSDESGVVESTKKYKIGENGAWQEYTSNGVIVTENNTTVHFTAKDNRGNVGNASYTVTNIDKIAPVITLTGDTSTSLQNSTLTASTEEGVEIYWSKDNANWSEYTQTLAITENGTWYFKATDAAGNTGTNSITFENIDTTAPVITLTGNTSDSLRTSTLTASTEEGVDIYWSKDNANWLQYTQTLDVTENGTWYFKATDAAENTGTASITFANIDTTAPVITLTGDNETSREESTLTASTEEGVKIYWSKDNANWSEYTQTLAITENGTWYFKATDAAGNVGTAQMSFDNIANEGPTIIPEPELTASAEGPFKVKATFSDPSGVKQGTQQYKIGNGEWAAYPADGVLVEGNCTVYFRAEDTLGNQTGYDDEVSYEVKNFGAPAITVNEPDTTTPTNQNVIITATITDNEEDEIVSQQYKIVYEDGSETEWKPYENEAEVPVAQNGIVYFKAVDAEGNEAMVASQPITNIDKLAPTISFSEETILDNGNACFTATPDEELASFQYSFDNAEWLDYDANNGVTVEDNCTVYFKATDLAGNETTESYTVTDIDKIPPQIQVTKSTNDYAAMLTLTVISEDEDMDAVLYRKEGEEQWNVSNYTDGGLAFEITENGTYQFKARDQRGNVTSDENTTVVTIDKIDAEAPAVPENLTAQGGVTATFSWKASSDYQSGLAGYEYRYGTSQDLEKEAAIFVTGTRATVEDMGPGSYYCQVRALDSVGNASEWSEAVPFDIEIANFDEDETITKINTPVLGSLGFDDNLTDTLTLQMEYAGLYVLTGEFGSLNASLTLAKGTKSIATGSIKNGVLTFNSGKPALLDGDTEYTITLKNTDKGKSASEYSIKATASAIFDRIDNSDDWTDLKTNGADSSEINTLGEISEESGLLVGDGWVGYGDSVDYMSFQLTSAANLSLNFTSTDATKAIIYTLNESNNSLKALQTNTLKLSDGEYKATGKALLLNAGTYYIAVTSTNAAKGGNADYTVSVNEASLFYTKGEDFDDWTDLKDNGADGEVDKLGKVTADSGKLVEDGWVGYGDAIDYAEFTLDSAASLAFDLTSTDAAKFTVYQLLTKENKGVTTYSLKSLQSTTLKANVNATTKTLLLGEGNYYVAMESTNAKKGGNADYTIALRTQDSVFFSQGNNSDDDWNAPNLTCLTLGEVEEEDWVGFGDANDYRQFTIEEDGFYSFGISGVTNNVKLTLYAVNGDKLKSIKSVSATAKNGTAEIKDVCLPAGDTQYILGVTATNANKAQNSYYTLSSSQNGVFNKDNNDWDTATPMGDGLDICLTSAANGDKVDFYDISELDTPVTLEMTSGKIKVSFYDENHKAVKTNVTYANNTLKSLNNLTLAAGNATTGSIVLSDLGDNVKFMKLEAASSNNNSCTLNIANA